MHVDVKVNDYTGNSQKLFWWCFIGVAGGVFGVVVVVGVLLR